MTSTVHDSVTVSAFEPGSVVWVKLGGPGGCWWPGSVCDPDEAPPAGTRKPPIAVVKFFQEDAFEYVKNISTIYPYNCDRKDEFIKKGLDQYRSKHGLLEKFPDDVIRAETLTDGDAEILMRDEYQEVKKESYAGLFGGKATSLKTPAKGRKGRLSSNKSKGFDTPKATTPRVTKPRTPGSYKVHILVQGSTPEPKEVPELLPTSLPASSSKAPVTPSSAPSTPVSSTPGLYPCHACSFVSSRLNVMIMHMKSHSYTSYTPTPTKNSATKLDITTPKLVKNKDTPVKTKLTPVKSKDSPIKLKEAKKVRKPRKSGTKRKATEDTKIKNIKRPKIDVAINTLLADWEDGDDESMDEPLSTVADRIPSTSEAEPLKDETSELAKPLKDETSELAEPLKDETSVLAEPLKDETSELAEPKEDTQNGAKESNNPSPIKMLPESGSCFDFREDDDWPVEKDSGRKIIPRIKKLESRKIDSEKETDEDVAKEVAELLEKTTVPELPSAPILNKFQENFPEVKKAKSPDKAVEKPEVPPQKVIFKTKTFFRSRHSSSQDAIGKYVAKWNASENLDSADSPSDANGSDAAPSPETCESPPIDHVKVARLAPKIQLKMMKAGMREKNKDFLKKLDDIDDFNQIPGNDDESKKEVELNKTEKTVDREDVGTGKNSEVEENSSDQKEEAIETNATCQNFIESQPEEDVEKHLVPIETQPTDVPDDPDLEQSEKLLTPTMETLMSESTASAVDALLSVSKDSDRLTRHITNDPPEDLFEDDNKYDNGNEINGLSSNSINTKSIEGNDKTGVLKEANTVIKSFITKFSLDTEETLDKEEKIYEPTLQITENIPTESDLQIAQALISLPATAIGRTQPENLVDESKIFVKDSDILRNQDLKKLVDAEIKETESGITNRENNFKDTDQIDAETNQYLKAAQSLVEMSKCIDHNVANETSTVETAKLDVNEIMPAGNNSIEKEMALLTDTTVIESQPAKPKFETTPSKLLQILEEPTKPRKPLLKMVSPAQVITPGSEKILNLEAGLSSPLKIISSQPQKQKLIIRHTSANKNIMSSIGETAQDKIVLSRSTKTMTKDGVSTYTIETTPESKSDSNTIIIQQKMRKISKPPPKLQKIRPQTTLMTSTGTLIQQSTQSTSTNEAIFDINSMPIVLSDELITAESIEKMPIVISDGNVSQAKQLTTKSVKSESSKGQTFMAKKPELKTFLMNPVQEKSTTPNILSKSSKLRGQKTMLIVKDQKIVMAQTESAPKDVKMVPSVPQSVAAAPVKTEKFILVPTTNTNRGRTQKIVIDGNSQRARIVLGKPPQTNSKPNSGELLSTGGEMTMIITNAQGDKTRVALTPEHKKLLFPNKMQQPQVKAIVQRPKPVTPTTTKQQIIVAVPKSVPKTQMQPRIVSKPMQHTIITSKGQLILPGMNKITSTIARPTASSESRPTVSTATRTFSPAPVKKLLKPAPAPANEPMLIIKKPGSTTTTLQLTAAQFEQLQKSGQIVQTTPIHTQVAAEPKVKIQSQVPRIPTEEVQSPATIIKKQIKPKVQRPAVSSPVPMKRLKTQERPPPPLDPPVPPLVPMQLMPAPFPAPTPTPVSQNNNLSDLDNLEELLPSTAIQRPVPEPPQPPPLPPQPEPAQQPPIPDSQLLAVPGENFGGPPNSFYLCVEDNGTLTPIDNRPLVLENNQLVPMAIEETGQLMLMSGEGQLVIGAEGLVQEPLAPQPERRDILAAALANTDVFQPDVREDIAPDFRDLNANVSVHCRVSETSTTLNQPIMTPLEVPTNVDEQPTVAASIEDGLAVIGVTTSSVPTSLELPITVTNPRIAPKSTNALSVACSSTYHSTGPLPSPGTLTDRVYLPHMVEEVSTHSISMPLLTEEDDSIAKSMPILTDEMAMETIASSVELTASSMEDSPCSADMREVTYPENEEDASAWSRKLLTPGSDVSEISAEIPIQPSLQLNARDLTELSTHNGQPQS